uniref:ENTH domain-containing protein n=1 Tax=Corethron hystrix TaxID=216773 RepID=A0A6U5KJG0_9STRA|mmetsp:Transcript_39476/g.92233  ORF Transcript_39476/g.92233 Transcript_39476/m.92233 type:complete len:291 (+) Transcript_39476:173-1045(+)
MDFLNSLTKDLSIDKVRNLAEDAINQAKPKTDVEKRVYEVLSHKNWGASSTLLNEIARDSYDFEKSNTISRLMWEGMASRPAGWRVVFKSLTLVEHLLKNGSERCVEDARNHQHQLSGMLSFNYYEDTVDRGAGVREKAKQMIELLADNERLREERVRAKALREKFGGAGASMPSSDIHGFASGGYGNGGIGSSSDGYGNSGLGSSGGGYGNGGIGSSGGVLSNSGFGSSGGGYGNSGIGSDTQFSGRYANDAVKNSYKDDVAPPSPKKDAEKDKTKTKKKKKKKDKEND